MRDVFLLTDIKIKLHKRITYGIGIQLNFKNESFSFVISDYHGRCMQEH